MKSRPSAFISHSSKDLPFARRLEERLRARDIDVWLDDLQLKAGDVLTGTIAQAVKSHDFLIVVLSNASLASDWVRREMRMAGNRRPGGRRARVVPLLLQRRAASRLPPTLRGTKYVDFSDHKTFEIGMAQLVDLMYDGAVGTERRRNLERIEFIHGDLLTEPLKRNIERILVEFQAYTHRLGFRSRNGAVEMSVETTTAFISYYDPVQDRIVTNIAYAGEEDYLRRDYTHHALATARADLWNRGSASWELASIESGLAAYFPCSFKNSHLFGEGAAHLVGESAPFFDLTNTRQMHEIKKSSDSVATTGLEVWGGTFWRLRAEFGRTVADRLLWRAWSSMRAGVPRFDVEFIRCLSSLDAETYKGRHTRRLRAIFAERGVGGRAKASAGARRK
jgi:hypothetical protein